MNRPESQVKTEAETGGTRPPQDAGGGGGAGVDTSSWKRQGTRSPLKGGKVVLLTLDFGPVTPVSGSCHPELLGNTDGS